jgi:cysteine desulfurase/selenocysteine lyase
MVETTLAQKIRPQFPILNRRINGKPFVYLDTGATSLKPLSVYQAVQHYLSQVSANIHRAVYTTGEEATRVYEETRSQCVEFVGAKSEREIIFTSGTTMGINLVARAWGDAFLKPGDEILVTTLEHHANLVPWQMLCERKGAVLKAVPLLSDGSLDLEAARALLGPKVKLFAFTLASNAIGTIAPAQTLISWAKEMGCVTLVDAAQWVGHDSLKVDELGCDFAVFSAHKMYGPTGVGVLYGKEALLEQLPPFLGGGDMIREVTLTHSTYADLPHRLEAGTPPIAEVFGFGAALDFMNSLPKNELKQQEKALRLYLENRLKELPEVKQIGTCSHRAGIVSFVVDGVHPHDVGTLLDQEGVAVRVGHHCAQPVLSALGVYSTVRASLGVYNTAEDVDTLILGLKKIIPMFR